MHNITQHYVYLFIFSFLQISFALSFHCQFACVGLQLDSSIHCLGEELIYMEARKRKTILKLGMIEIIIHMVNQIYEILNQNDVLLSN